MTRLVALLRGINVGGHTVKMKDLQRHFHALGFADVETVIASGNVVFETPLAADRHLEQMIENHLEQALGYGVATFLRTIPELAAVAGKQPFTIVGDTPDEVVYAIFVRDAVTAGNRRTIEALSTDNDEVRVGKRVVYWHRHARCKDSEIFSAKLTRALGSATTSRNLNTVRAIAQRYGS